MTSASVPPSPRASALEADPVLGKPLGNYVSDRFRLLLIGGGAVLVMGLIANFTLGTIQEGWGPPLTVLFTTGTALVAGWFVLHLWNREVILYERGFTIGEGARVVPIHYAEVVTVRLKVERYGYLGGLIHTTRTRITLTTQYDEQVVITDWYRRTGELGSRLVALVDAALRPIIEARWARGETVPFGGALALSAEGLHTEGRLLPWADYGGYRIADRRLMVLDSRGAPFASTVLADTGNLTLLIALLRERKPANSHEGTTAQRHKDGEMPA